MTHEEYHQQQLDQQEMAHWFFFGTPEQKAVAAKHYEDLHEQIKDMGKPK